MGENHLNYYDLPSVNLSKYVKLLEDRTIYTADKYQGVTGAASDSLTIAYGEPAYVEMPIAEEVEMNQVSLKSSLKSMKNPEIVAKYTNLLYYFL